MSKQLRLSFILTIIIIILLLAGACNLFNSGDEKIIEEDPVLEPTDYLMTFDTLGGREMEGIRGITLKTKPIPINDDSLLMFSDWYDNPDYNGVPIAFPYTMTADITLFARWARSPNLIVVDYVLNGGTNSSSNRNIVPNHQRVLHDPEYIDGNKLYDFQGWYDNPDFIGEALEIIPWQDITLYAKWSSEPLITYTRDTVNDIDYIYMGLYPQTIVSSQQIIDALDTGIADSTITQDSRGWYLYQGEYYHLEAATNTTTSCTFSNSVPIESGKSYYYKVEPIKWRVLSDSNGIFLISEYILDRQIYRDGRGPALPIGNGSVTGTRWEDSYLREWLNDDFYLNAFDSTEKRIIPLRQVHFGASHCYYKDNAKYADSSYDYVFVPSYAEMVSLNYGYQYNNDRQSTITDYTHAKEGSLHSEPDSTGNYWLRSMGQYAAYGNLVSHTGEATYSFPVTSRVGVRPMIYIKN